MQELAEMVQDREGIPPDQSRFIFEGKQLQKDMTFGDYDIRSGCTLIHILKLRGD